MNFPPPKNTIILRHSEHLDAVMSKNRFRAESHIFYPIHSLMKNNEIDDVTNKAVPIEIAPITESVVDKVRADLKGSGMSQTVLRAFQHPAGSFLNKDSIAVGHSSIASDAKRNVPSSSEKKPVKKLKTNDDVFSGKGRTKKGRAKKPLNQFRVVS